MMTVNIFWWMVSICVPGVLTFLLGYSLSADPRTLRKLVRYRVAAEEAAKWLGEDGPCRLVAEWITAEGQDYERESISKLRDRIRQIRALSS